MAAGGHFGWPKITFSTFLAISDQYVTFFLFGHFGWPKITFDNISRHFRSIRNFYFFQKMAAGGHFGWAKITFDHISRHFRSIHKFYFFWILFTKWLPAAILDEQKSLRSHFSPFQINTQLLFLWIFLQNGCWRPFWMTENHFHSHFSAFQINTQLFFFFFFFTKWAAILDDRKSLSITFLAISDQYATFFFSKNGCRWPFWMTENHFRSHFSPFQINTQLFFFFFFFSKWTPAAILGFRFLPKWIGTPFYSMSVATSNINLIGAFLIIVIEGTSFFIIFSQNGRRRPFWFFLFSPKSIGFFHSRSSMDVSNMNLIRTLVSQLRETQALACGGCGGGDGVGTKTIISPKFQISGILLWENGPNLTFQILKMTFGII